MKPCTEPPADPHFRPRRTDRTTEDHDAENCDASMVLRFALLLSSGHIFYLSCNHFVSPSPLFPLSLSPLFSALCLSHSAEHAFLLRLFVFLLVHQTARRIYLYLLDYVLKGLPLIICICGDMSIMRPGYSGRLPPARVHLDETVL